MNSIRQIEVIYDNRPVGRMALSKDGLCAFEYSNEWLNSGFSISPFELPLKAASGSLMIACRMGGGCLCWTDIYRKKGSIHGH